METLQNSVRERRQLAGMSQDALAAAVNVTRQTIIAIEKQDYVPSALLALKLASVLQTQVEKLFWIEHHRKDRS